MPTLFRLLSLQYLRRHIGRVLLAVAGIALGVTTWTASFILGSELTRSLHRQSDPLNAAADFLLDNGDSGVQYDLLDQVRTVPGVRAAEARVIERAAVTEIGAGSAVMIGADTDQLVNPQVAITSIPINESTYSILVGRRPAIIGRRLYEAMGGKRRSFHLRIGGRAFPMHAVGILDADGVQAPLAGMTVFLSTIEASALSGRPNLASRIDVWAAPDVGPELLRGKLSEIVAGRAKVHSPVERDERFGEALEGLKVGFAASGAGAIALGAFLVQGLVSVSVAERNRQTGILQAIGATRGQVVLLFIGEAVVLGLVGGALGILGGYVVASSIASPLRQIIGSIFVPLDITAPRLEWAPVATALAVGTLLAVVASIVPALRATANMTDRGANINPTAGARCGANLRIALAAAFTVFGIMLIRFRHWLPTRLATYGGLVLPLLAFCLLVPPAISILARWAQRRWGSKLGLPLQIALDNLVYAPARTGNVAMAIAISIGLMTQMSGVILSNEAGVARWLRDSIAGDLFITSGGPMSASGQLLPMSVGLKEQIAETLPDATTVAMRFRYIDGQFNGTEARVLLVALDAPQYVTANAGRSQSLPDLESYRHLCEPNTAVVSENFATRYGFHLGEAFVVPGIDSTSSRRIVGIVPDYSCSRGTILIDNAQLHGATRSNLVDVFDVYLPNQIPSEYARKRIQNQSWSDALSLCIATKGELTDHILEMVNRLYGLARIQEAAVAALAATGIFSALAMSVVLRRRELALLRSQGATRTQVATIVFAESMLLCVTGSVVGVALGLPLDWYAVRWILPAETGFILPFCFPWLDAAALPAIAVLMGIILAAPPAVAAARTSMSRASNED